MSRPMILVLQVVLALILAGTLFVQVIMMPLLSHDLSEDFNADVADVAVRARRGDLMAIVVEIDVIQARPKMSVAALRGAGLPSR